MPGPSGPRSDAGNRSADGEAQRAERHLILLAHAELRALREVVAMLMPPSASGFPVHAGNWEEVEAECRRKHFEALGLSLDRFEALLGDAELQRCDSAPPPEEGKIVGFPVPADERSP